MVTFLSSSFLLHLLMGMPLQMSCLFPLIYLFNYVFILERIHGYFFYSVFIPINIYLAAQIVQNLTTGSSFNLAHVLLTYSLHSCCLTFLYHKKFQLILYSPWPCPGIRFSIESCFLFWENNMQKPCSMHYLGSLLLEYIIVFRPSQQRKCINVCTHIHTHPISIFISVYIKHKISFMFLLNPSIHIKQFQDC